MSKKKLARMATVIALTLSSAACGGPTSSAATTQAKTVLVVARRSNMPDILTSSGGPGPLLTEVAKTLVNVKGIVYVVRSDGSPVVAGQVGIDPYVGNNQPAAKATASAQTSKLANVLTKASATTAEADPIEALNLGVRTARGSTGGRVIMIDNGLSTSGSVLMQTGISTSYPAENVAKQVLATGEVEDMSGITIEWYGLGESVSPQERVPTWARTKLKTFYESLVKGAKGAIVWKDDPLSNDAGPAALPPVTPVPFSEAQAPTTSVPPEVTYVLNEHSLPFKSNSTELSNPAEAKTFIETLVPDINRVQSINIVGCTAKNPGSSDAQLEAFALQRALRIQSLLADAGVKVPMNAVGYGWKCPGYVTDTDAAGKQVESSAAKNRRVIISSEPIERLG